jgi:hypothetical protein
MVDVSDTAPRVAEKSLCTIGNTTTIDHMPTAPMAPISTAMTSRAQA